MCSSLPTRTEAVLLANEQTALRRVAVLVARGVSSDELFGAVAAETASLVGADAAALLRFEPDDRVTLVAAWARAAARFPIGGRGRLDRALRELREHGAPLRFGPAELSSAGPFSHEAHRLGIRAAVGVPILVDGRAWGVCFVGARGHERFPPDTEARLAGFTALVATAIASAQARSELQRLVDEQAALRRVAEQVARAAQPEEVFAAVVEEVGRLLPVDDTAMLRDAEDGSATVVAGWSRRGDALRAGTRIPGAGAHVPRTTIGRPIVVDGRLWGSMVAAQSDPDALPAGSESCIAQFGELVATAIANADRHAQLMASRARVVAAADESRRRIQRDLHDGAQQRLVHTIISLQLAQAAAGAPRADLVTEALGHAERALTELRELASGIVPGALERGGLRAALQALTGDLELPVHVEIEPVRLPSAVERAAYFVAAEAITNTLKHARATTASVRAVADGDVLELEIRDDGAGGADPARGTGLVGLADRVAAGGGGLTIDSPAGGGTALTARLPLGRHAPERRHGRGRRRFARPPSAASPAPEFPLTQAPC